MAINVPIVSEFQPSGLKKAMAEFKRLETTGQKVAFGLKKAFLPATAALGGLAVAGAKMVAAGEQAATANARIEQIAASMGLFGQETGKVTDRLVDLANEQARLTGVNQNTIKESQALLLTFRDIATSADKVGGAFDRATQLTLDMASAGFGSVTDNAKQLGKALNDPIAGLTALRRSGIQFTEQQQDQIRTLVESGRILEAQNLVLQEIENQVGGTAEATANSTDKMKVAFSQASESIGMALLPAVEALLPYVIGMAEWASENTELIIILAGVIGGLSAVIIAANFAMKAWAAAQAIATAAQWAFNAALTANPIGIVVVAIGALVAGLVILYNKSEKVRAVLDAMFGVLGKVGDAIGWVAGKLGIGDEAVEDFTRTVDTARQEAGDMYAPLKEMGDQSEDTAAQMETLAEEINAVERELRELNPALDRTLELLDVQDDIASLEQAFRDWKDTLADSTANTWDQEEAQRELTRRIIETLKAHELLTLAFDEQLKMKIDTGDLDAAYDSALRVLDAFEKVKAVSSGAAPASTYLPGPGELEFLTGAVQTIDIAAGGTATRDFQSGDLQNITINVQTLEPTPSVGRAIVDSVRKAQRSGSTPGIGRR